MILQHLKLILSYDGSNYLGWQATKEGLSIEETLQKAIEKILQQPVRLEAASRTDAGVHAKGQVVSFFAHLSKLDLKKLHISLNQLLPKDIRVLSLELVSMDFHPTLDGKEKEYVYQLSTSPFQCPFKRQTSWHFPFHLDMSMMEKAAMSLIGEKDFKGFTNTKKNPHETTIRTIHSIRIEKQQEDIIFTIRGNHFLYKMVRNIVGTLCYIGCEKLPLSVIADLLQNKQRAKGGMTAPAHGLTLSKVIY